MRRASRRSPLRRALIARGRGSEGKGDGNGRVYLIIGSGHDTQGLTGFDCSTVVVPHDQSRASIAFINQQAVAARAYCKANGVAPSGYVQVGIGPIVGP